MEQTLSESRLRMCYKCRYEAITPDKNCPRCGRILYTQTKVRVLGAILIFLGGFIATIMTGVIYFAYNVVSGYYKGQGFHGTQTQLMLIFGVLGMAFAVGISFAIAGIWQVVFGRRNMVIIWICLALVFATIAGGGIIQVILQ